MTTGETVIAIAAWIGRNNELTSRGNAKTYRFIDVVWDSII